MRFIALILTLLAISLPAAAQDCILPIGSNLAGPADYGAEYPWVNLMTEARTWITHNATWVDGGENLWDTGYLDQIPRDPSGYPLALPVTIDGAEDVQVVRTVWANTGKLQAGVYTVLWDGQGTLDIWGDQSTVLSNQPGRLTFSLEPVDAGLFALEILASEATDHVRNIRVLLPGTEATYQQEEWSEPWLQHLEPFDTLRFMDWGQTNHSPRVQWSGRAAMEYYTYTERGVPYERWVEICNRLEKDAWVCVPHMADDDYIRQMACFFRDGLDPERVIYLEYSNELWNWMFSQAQYCLNEGDQDVPWPERIAPFIQNVFDIWSEEFAGQEHRLVRTVGVQASYQDVSNRIVGSLRPGSFDAFAPAAYFGFTDEGYTTLESLGSAATGEDALQLAWDGFLQDTMPWLRSQKQNIGDVYGIPMHYYEGGQHLTPRPFGSDQPYAGALLEVQRLPGMQDLYAALLDSLETLSDADAPSRFLNFSYMATASARYGSWGVLEHQFVEHNHPKYDALVAHACQGVSRSPHVPRKRMAELRSAAPNPFNPGTTLRFELVEPRAVDLAVYDATGRLVRRLITDAPHEAGQHAAYWDGRGNEGRVVAAGVYFCRLKAGDEISRLSVCLLK